MYVNSKTQIKSLGGGESFIAKKLAMDLQEISGLLFVTSDFLMLFNFYFLFPHNYWENREIQSFQSCDFVFIDCFPSLLLCYFFN